MATLFKLFGVIGLLLITRAIFVQKETRQDWYFVLGGLFLLAYSSYLRDPIFIILQIVFTVSSLYEIYKIKKTTSHLPIAVSTDEVIRLENGKEADL